MLVTIINFFKYCISVFEGKKEDSHCLLPSIKTHLKHMLKILSILSYQRVSE